VSAARLHVRPRTPSSNVSLAVECKVAAAAAACRARRVRFWAPRFEVGCSRHELSTSTSRCRARSDAASRVAVDCRIRLVRDQPARARRCACRHRRRHTRERSRTAGLRGGIAQVSASTARWTASRGTASRSSPLCHRADSSQERSVRRRRQRLQTSRTESLNNRRLRSRSRRRGGRNRDGLAHAGVRRRDAAAVSAAARIPRRSHVRLRRLAAGQPRARSWLGDPAASADRGIGESPRVRLEPSASPSATTTRRRTAARCWQRGVLALMFM